MPYTLRLESTETLAKIDDPTMPLTTSQADFERHQRRDRGPAAPCLTARRGGLALWLFVAAFGPVAPAADEDSGRLVTARPAERQVILTGFTRARAELPLVTETQGRIETVLYDIGDAIGDDGLFARVDTTFIALELEEVVVQQEKLRERIALDRREAERYRKLARQNNVSASQAEALELTLSSNRHELEALEIRERRLRERLARARIHAPPRWRVTARTVEPGQWVQAGEVLGAVADFTTLLVPFALTPGQHAALERQIGDLVLALPDIGQQVPASVYRVNPGFDPATRKIRVELAVDGDPQPRRGGLRARLALRVPEQGDTIVLPAAAVAGSYEEHWVIRADGERVPVLLLGPARGATADLVRVSAPTLHPGQRFHLVGAD
ncbi:RND family efflux transporter, MFP subunit [Thioflavicoccus mobilis 8321]|uniref:RND family efflux transporter, MFP subunit n=1 Tax=Thioflavicoccus mobilis 8321 TaxID=765912 RepID=L0GX26_9GAMM|nr:efflux RND transporter periplasmic adaptor subunit [Thioflavicoccus mobilis]AGA90382.1 RND family efflux transporter, MFP subunit [Thioflavicoccus mobilis 8321]